MQKHIFPNMKSANDEIGLTQVLEYFVIKKTNNSTITSLLKKAQKVPICFGKTI